jgi:hypothetical protein
MLKGWLITKELQVYKFTIKNNSIKNIIYMHLQDLQVKQKNDRLQFIQSKTNQVCLMCAG